MSNLRLQAIWLSRVVERSDFDARTGRGWHGSEVPLENRAFVTGDAEVGHRTMYGLDFGEPQRVETRRGTAYVREAAPTEQFGMAWRQNEDAVKPVGFSLRKYHDEWSVSYWSDSEDCPLPKPLP